ncbi:Uma2 family endonuclease [Oscillatoria sp. FACHB-1406]|uniref:Uma2 family endonuclease n=1 Tax=Oscillatoria sp. FACHB-1406 TaxID=2692846 RepID=UPI00168A3E9E|nr:Uma2 family endonuclease [Oscillatoria sp. FACHB-1406]MBD2577496.1 Uma2 family endonuclease [Oscillatoria sp. FACHB-1406]
MVSLTVSPQTEEIEYPSEDGEPLAETYDHLYAILMTLEVLRRYLQGRRVTVLADQIFYYVENFPKIYVVPDVMVIFDVEPGGRDSYKLWEEKQAPKVIFEMTSRRTKNKDMTEKKALYEGLGVREYWLFDPKKEWIEEQLVGYRLLNGEYVAIADRRSQVLQLRLEVDGKLIAFYREDTGEKLLIPDELSEALTMATAAQTEAEERAEAERQRAEELEALLRQYQERFGDLPE